MESGQREGRACFGQCFLHPRFFCPFKGIVFFSGCAASGGQRRPFGSARGGRRPFGSARGGSAALLVGSRAFDSARRTLRSQQHPPASARPYKLTSMTILLKGLRVLGGGYFLYIFSGFAIGVSKKYIKTMKIQKLMRLIGRKSI